MRALHAARFNDLDQTSIVQQFDMTGENCWIHVRDDDRLIVQRGTTSDLGKDFADQLHVSRHKRSPARIERYYDNRDRCSNSGIRHQHPTFPLKKSVRAAGSIRRRRAPLPASVETLAGGLDLAATFLNFGNDAIDTGRQCLGRSLWKERAKFIDEIFTHLSEFGINFQIRLVSKCERNIVGGGDPTLQQFRYFFSHRRFPSSGPSTIVCAASFTA